MTFETYQQEAKKTAIYPEQVKGLYPLLGLFGETAETIEKARIQLQSFSDKTSLKIEGEPFFKKLKIEDAFNQFVSTGQEIERIKKDYRKYGLGYDAYFKVENSPEEKEELKKELGDILWYMAAICSDYGISLQDVAETNIAKLKSRQERNVLDASGDNR